MMTHPENLDDVLAEHEDLRDGIERAVRADPSRLRQILADLGYLDGDQATQEEPDPTDAERELLEVVEGLGTPKTTAQIIEIIQAEHPEKLDTYGSMKHRTWVNNKLNSLVKKGSVGKYRDGRTVRYTPSPREAVRHWARQNSMFVSDVGFDDIDGIIDDTGMNRTAVTHAVDQLRSETDRP